MKMNMKKKIINEVIEIVLFALFLYAFTMKVNADSKDFQTPSTISSQSLSPYQKGEIFDFAEEAYAEGDYDLAYNLFQKISNRPDVIKRLEEIETIRKQKIYDEADKAFDEEEYDLAVELYDQIRPFADADAKIIICEAEIQKRLIEYAEEAYSSGDYDLALSYINGLDTFDANVLKKKIFIEKQQQIYNAAEEAFNEEEYDEAVTLFSSIPDYLDSNIRATLSRQKAYEEKVAEEMEEKYELENFS